MDLLTKEISSLTSDELKESSKSVGTSGLPYPSVHFVADGNGKLKMEIGMITDDAHPLTAYSNRSHAYVVGQLFRKMAIPSMLHIQNEALLRRAPSSKNRVMLILGRPGTGKSEGAKTITDLCDERGAIVEDCGGRYLGNLLWEDVIDYGEDFKTALTERIRSGTLTKPSIDAIDGKFSDALIRDKKGKITGIDWSKTVDNSIDIDVALRQSVDFAKTIAEYESIPTQTVNSVGIKKIPGVIKNAFDEGRTLILDEYTKSIEGSDDSLQTVLQFLKGEIDECTVTNTMKVAGREESYEYTLRRSDMKAGFFVYMTGNDQEDGISTHMLSKSAYDRIPLFKIEELQAVDWTHRISQVLTGLPLSTLYMAFSSMGQSAPEEFGQMMTELRLMGLSAEEQAKVPASQLSFLSNWQDTNSAIEKLANFYMYWANIINPASELYDADKPQYQTNIDNIMPEISPQYSDECSIGFRKFMDDVENAMTVKPVVSQIHAGSDFRLNFSEIGRQKGVALDRPEVVSAEFGSRLEAVLLERIGAMTQGRPNLQAALIKEAYERGVLTIASAKEDKPTVGKLLNQDMYAAVGGIKSVVNLRDALISRLKQANPDLANKTDEEVMPLNQAAAACEELSGMASEVEKKTTPRTGELVIVGNDLAHIFNRVSAVDGSVDPSGKQIEPKPAELVSTTDFLESLKIPAVADMDMKAIWRSTFSSEKTFPANWAPAKIAQGKSPSGIGITTLMMQSANDDHQMVPVHIMRDEERKKALIVTDAVDPATKAALSGDFTVVSYDDPNAEGHVANFINETLNYSGRKADMTDFEKNLTTAFTLRAANESQLDSLAQMMTAKNQSAEAAVYVVNKPM